MRQGRRTERDEVGAVGDGLVVEVGYRAGGPEAGGDGLEELEGGSPACDAEVELGRGGPFGEGGVRVGADGEEVR